VLHPFNISLRLINRRMRKRPGVINHGPEIANVDPPAALGAPDVAVRRLLRGLALPLIQVLASHKRPHRKASLIRFIAGCSGFFIFTQLGETPERYGRSTGKCESI
jgi:hypothetical protein